MNAWDQAATLRKESAAIYRSAYVQATAMAHEGRTSAEIDAATAKKTRRMAELQVEISALIQQALLG